jgi:putative oxidoreductase
MDKTLAASVPNHAHLGVAIGRLLMAVLFLVSGLLKITHLAAVTTMLVGLGMPFAHGVAPLVAMFETGGGLSLALGWQTRRVAMALALFVVPATLMFHSFWNADAATYSNQLNHFLKNVAIFGALLIVASSSPTSQVGKVSR